MPKTYNELYLQTRRIFRDNGISGYNLEARLLIAFAAGKSMEQFLREKELYTSDEMERQVRELTARRLSGEPVAYITGNWEFYGLPLEVGPGVLIPRMDTELLADTAIRALVANRMDARVLDLCAGSGCVGLAIAMKLPRCRVLLVDNSPQALAICGKNIAMHNLFPRVTCTAADVLEPPPSLIGSFDLVVCNPPYIPSGDIAGLDISVRDFEPVEALDGGRDGIRFFRAVLDGWKGVVREGGALMFEVGAGQAKAVKKLMRLAGLKSVGSVVDTGDVERVLYGRT